MSTAYQREFTPLAAAGWSTAVVLALALLLGILSGGRSDALPDLVTIGLAMAVVHFGIAFAAVRVHAPEGSLRLIFGVGSPKTLDFCAAIMTGVGIVPFLDWLDALTERRFPQSAADAATSALMFANGTPALRLKIGVVLVLLLPLAQELFFRGLIFSGLSARSSGRSLVAVVVSTIAFALSSASPRAIPPMVVLGLILGCVRAWSQSVVVSMVAHASYSLISELPLLQGRPPDTSIAVSFKQAVAMTIVAAIALVVLGIRARAPQTVDEPK